MTFGNWLGLLAICIALLLLWSLRELVILALAAIVIAMALCTLVGSVRQRLGCSRPLALLLSLGGLALLLTIGLTAVVPPFAEQFSQLLAKLPDAARVLTLLLRQALEGASSMLYGHADGGLDWLQQSWGEALSSRSDTLLGGLSGGASKLLNIAGSLGSGVLQLLFILAVALMIAAQPRAYRDVVILLVPSFYRRRALVVLGLCAEALSSWMVGVVISSCCVGVLAAIGLSLLGVKLVAANALLAAVLNIIPNIGPTLSTVFPMAVALLDSPWKALVVLVLYIGIQMLESYVITPSVMHAQLKLLPGLTLLAQLMFTVLFGPLGLLLALPLAVCLQVVVREVLIRDILDVWPPVVRRRP
ncbi:MAG: AI-2E family transporter [Cyanobacteriota bacterium]